MKRLLLTIAFMLFFTTMANAGELDRILAKSSGTMLYLYSPTCTYCQKFDPNFKKLSGKYGQKYQFVKINIASEEGKQLLRELGARYVPYVMMFNAKKRTVAPLEPDCMVSYSCSENAIKKQFN